jgi:hypothetical protein
MSSIISFAPNQLKYMYSYLYPMKQKDKIDMILEPLQAMIQLSLLSVCPIGTKITIQENILYIQHPSIIQPISRWYKSDKKDDLLFLFQVIRRFIKWYNPYINKNNNTIIPQNQILNTSPQIQSQSQTPNTTPTLSSINNKNVNNSNNNNKKDRKNSFNSTPTQSPSPLNLSSPSNTLINNISNITLDDSEYNTNNNNQIENDRDNDRESILSIELYRLIIKMSISGLDNLLKTYGSTDNNTIIQVIYMYKNLLQTNDNIDVDKIFSENGEKSINMDEIFVNIIKLYDTNLLNLVYNTLIIVNKEVDENNIVNFIDGFNLLMSKNNKLIQCWIKVNLVF